MAGRRAVRGGSGREGPSLSPRRAGALARRLLRWYDGNRRSLPWRAAPGKTPDPYRVWIAEIMAQQTRVATAAPYYEAFVRRFPAVSLLAEAPLDEVLHAWQGLGYYARARNLHAAARIVVDRFGGRIPEDEATLRTLPGIGPYTAAGIAAIAFDRPAVVVDGNVERVIARHFAVDGAGAKRRVRGLAAGIVPSARARDFAQAFMDLGGTVCTPRNPRCGSCPWKATCRALDTGRVLELPARPERAARPVKRGVAFFVTDGAGAVLLRRRPDGGLLGGMMEVPSTAWRRRAWTLSEARAFAPVRARFRALPGTVRHGFSHFDLEIRVLSGRAGASAARAAGGIWCPPARLSDHALPALTRKVVARALARG